MVETHEHEKPLNFGDIIEWANRWHRSDDSPVPKFTQTLDIHDADVRLNFTGKLYSIIHT